MAEKMRRKEERTGEKSNFSITCSLLSQYLKEKGSFGKLGLEMHSAPRPLDQQHIKGKLRGPPTTMTLLPGAYVSDDDDDDERAEERAVHGDPKSMDLFPDHRAGFGSPINTLPLQEEPHKAAAGGKDVERAQLTIFYGGKVLVFDNFPSDKAMDLMQTCSLSAVPAPAPVPAMVNPVPAPECSSRPPLFVSSTSTSQVPSSPTAAADSENGLAKPEQTSASDMPIARRNSLHRFLEKRKDRIITKAPYEVRGGSPARADEAKPENSKPWSSSQADAAKPESSKSWLSARPDVAKPESSKSWLSARPDEAKPESSKSWLSARPDAAKPESSKSWLSGRPDEAKPESSKSWLGLGRQDSKSENSSGSSR